MLASIGLLYSVVYFGLLLKNTEKVQLVQNVAAWIITSTPWFAHRTPVLWQQFWVLIVIFKALHIWTSVGLWIPVDICLSNKAEWPFHSSCGISTAHRSAPFPITAPFLWYNIPPDGSFLPVLFFPQKGYYIIIIPLGFGDWNALNLFCLAVEDLLISGYISNCFSSISKLNNITNLFCFYYIVFNPMHGSYRAQVVLGLWLLIQWLLKVTTVWSKGELWLICKVVTVEDSLQSNYYNSSTWQWTCNYNSCNTMVVVMWLLFVTFSTSIGGYKSLPFPLLFCPPMASTFSCVP